MNLSVQKQLNLRTVEQRYRGFRLAKSAIGGLLLVLFGLSPLAQAAPDLTATTMVGVLQNDANSDGLFSPGDTIRYIVTIDNTGDVADTNVVFTITPDTDTTLPGSSVTTTQGTVTTGNTVGDTTVSVNVGSIAVGSPVSISIEVTINSSLDSCTTSVTTQGTVTSDTHSGGIPTDDLNNAAVDDATVTSLTVPNNAPTATDNTVSTPQNTQIVFAATDFNFSDIDCSNSLSKIQITALESVGDLYLDANGNDTINAGEDVTTNQEIDAVDILSLKFIPVTDATGSPYTTFKFKVKDATDYSAAEYTMTIDVVANVAPTGTDKTVTIDEDASHTFAEADFGYSDADSDPFTSIEITQLETASALQLSSVDVTLTQVIPVADIPNLTFTPSADANGSPYSTFQFTVNDSKVDSTSAYTITMNVTAQPDNPTAADNTVTTNEDTTYTFAEADFGFSDVDGDTLASVKITTLETVGDLKISGADVVVALNDVIPVADITAGNLTFAPVANASGTGYDTFQFTVNDGTSDSASANTMTVNVTAVNDPPTLTAFLTAVDTTNENTEIEITLADLTAQGDEADIDGTVDAFIVKTVSTGTLKIGADSGSATAYAATTNETIDGTNNAYWTPALAATGTLNAFEVVAKDDSGAESALPSVIAQVTATAVNDPPTLTAFAAVVDTTAEDTEVEITFAELTAQGDQADVDGSVVAFIVKSVPTGTLKIGANAGTATAYAATTNETIDATNNAYWTPALDATGTLNAIAVVAKDDGSPLPAVESTPSVTATVTVTPVDDPPTLTAFSAAVDTTNEDTEVEITFADLTAQGDEADDGTVDAFIVKTVSTGTLKIGTTSGTAGAWVAGTLDTIDATNNAYWTPAADANGAPLNAFEVVAKDNNGTESTGNVMATVTVTAVNDPPTLTAFTAAVDTVNEDTEVEITFTELTAQGDQADIDGTVDAFIVKSVSTGTLKIGTDSGTATAWAATTNETIDASNNAYWTPAADANGAPLNAFEVVAKDNGGAESTSNVMATVTVTAVNDPPTLTAFTAAVDTVNEDTEVEITLTDLTTQGDEADVDGTVDAFIVKSVVTGTLKIGANSGAATAYAATTNETINGSNNAYWTPALNANGTLDAFYVVAQDNSAAQSTGNVTAQVTVNAVNDPPTALDNAVTINEDTDKTFAEAEFNFSDIDGDILNQIEITTLPAAGTLYVDANTNSTVDGGEAVTALGTVVFADIPNFKFQPVANANGAAYTTFTFKVNDGTAYSASAYTMTINVTAINDAPSFVGLDGTPTFIENGSAVVLDSNATVADPELDAAN